MSSTIEIKRYLERAQAAIKESQDILDLGHYNVVVSRAYYAMFYAANALLASKGISRNTHSGVRSAFSQYFVKPGLIEPSYSRMLLNAFDVRLDSDYDVASSVDLALAENILNDAEQFVERAANYLDQEGY